MAEEIAAGPLSPVELTDSVLARHRLAHVCADPARDQARKAEKENAEGRHRGRCTGTARGRGVGR